MIAILASKRIGNPTGIPGAPAMARMIEAITGSLPPHKYKGLITQSKRAVLPQNVLRYAGGLTTPKR
ncbi:hypothetical protein, partial [Sphingobium scionense]